MGIKEDLLTSKKYIGSLMRAQNPKTGEDISSATLRSEEAFDALSYVSRTLDDAIEGLEQRIEEDVAAKLDKARAEAYEKAKEELIPKYEQLLKEASSGKKVKLEAPKAPKYTKEQEPVPEMYEIELRGHKAEVPITFAKIFLADVQTNINNAFAEENVVVSLNYLLNLLKDKGLIALGRLGNQNKLIPTKIGSSLLIDCGANVDAKPENLVQFAKMGSIYMENIEGIKNPRVAIVNIGAEDEKGNALVKETIPMLRECKDINFIGSIESREIPNGGADVIVCEAFVGNVLLKFYEGVGKMFLDEVKGTLKSKLKTKIGGALIYKDLKKCFKRFMADDKGGAPLLGLKGLVVKIHGNSKNNEVSSAIAQCRRFIKNQVNEKIINAFENGEN